MLKFFFNSTYFEVYRVVLFIEFCCSPTYVLVWVKQVKWHEMEIIQLNKFPLDYHVDLYSLYVAEMKGANATHTNDS
jgi:hypothetical protein